MVEELRIGNWANIEGNELLVDGRVIYDLWMDNFLQSNGIPLTEEWLLKFAFTLKYRSEVQKQYKKNDRMLITKKDVMNDEWYLFDGENDFVNNNPILYVHQLQNLWFV